MREQLESLPEELTIVDHVGVLDDVEEEGQHLHHLVLRLSVLHLARAEGLRDVRLEEGRVDGVHDLYDVRKWHAYIEEVLAVDRILMRRVGEVVSDAAVA